MLKKQGWRGGYLIIPIVRYRILCTSLERFSAAALLGQTNNLALNMFEHFVQPMGILHAPAFVSSDTSVQPIPPPHMRYFVQSTSSNPLLLMVL